MLAFSQFVSVLSVMREVLEERELPYAYLDSQTKNRREVCERFNGDPSIPFSLISLRAGGARLIPTGADTVMHWDPWWIPRPWRPRPPIARTASVRPVPLQA